MGIISQCFFHQLEILTNLATETNISTILREFQVWYTADFNLLLGGVHKVLSLPVVDIFCLNVSRYCSYYARMSC